MIPRSLDDLEKRTVGEKDKKSTKILVNCLSNRIFGQSK